MDIKERMKIERHAMPEQPPAVRARNFEEVPLGYSDETAIMEAQRCIQCKKPFCMEGCPVSVKIPEFIKLIREGEFVAAARKIKETNALPAVCGRVCPQEAQCEGKCILGKKGEPVAIGRLERFCADYERNHELITIPLKETTTNRKVAVIGSGPAGLTVAGDLLLKGHDVTIYEALHKPGGVLVYGIPEFRLPKSIVDSEVNYLCQLGARLELNTVVGTAISVDDLFNVYGFHAVFIAVGAGLPKFLNIEGENLCGVYSANEYLTRVNLMKAYKNPTFDTPVFRGRRVAVVGGGNVAMDCLRTAMRLGAEKVFCVYRRAMEQMPARAEEIHHAKEEGIEFHLLRNPTRVLGDERGWVRGMEVVKMELGEPDDSGRRRPVEVEGSQYVLDVDTVIVGIGSDANPLLTSTMPDLKLNRWGNIKTDYEGRTSVKGVWAAGDIVTGAATVILAAGAGKICAQSIHEYLNGNDDWNVHSFSTE
ncbi:MAG TPA: NADPH-dependent glutamate synthase [Euryarchaeota archaeon]|nr:NADPH-dependent glutamate synthase [Euryarchaeota archaeon]